MTACIETHLSSLLFPLSLVLLIVSVTLPSLPLIRSFATFFANPFPILFFLILFICFSPFLYLFCLNILCTDFLVLSSPPSVIFSSFFFFPRWNEEQDLMCIKLHGVNRIGLKKIIDFIYTAKLSLNMENLQDTLEAASFLQILPVLDFCKVFLISGVGHCSKHF